MPYVCASVVEFVFTHGAPAAVDVSPLFTSRCVRVIRCIMQTHIHLGSGVPPPRNALKLSVLTRAKATALQLPALTLEIIGCTQFIGFI